MSGKKPGSLLLVPELVQLESLTLQVRDLLLH
jgi:hypothetical protein